MITQPTIISPDVTRVRTLNDAEDARYCGRTAACRPIAHSEARTLKVIRILQFVGLALGIALPLSGAPSAGAGLDASWQERSLAVLREALETTQDWVRVHAAEALIEHGQPAGIAALYLPQADTAAPPMRIGVWRVLARTAETPERKAEFIARIRTALHDPNGPDRVHAAETLAKLSAGLPEDLPVLKAWLPQTNPAIAAYLRWLIVQGSADELQATVVGDLADLLRAEDPIGRLRAAFGLSRIGALPPNALRLLRDSAESEPRESPARPYILVAALRHLAPGDAVDQWSDELRSSLPQAGSGAVREIAPALGRRGDESAASALERLLQADDADIRIGAADGILHLLNEHR